MALCKEGKGRLACLGKADRQMMLSPRHLGYFGYLRYLLLGSTLRVHT